MEDRHCIIVGAGIAGMSCALRLQERGVPYTLVSETIGGRICYLREYGMNFGAVFYMQHYAHAKELLAPAQKVLPSYFDLECHKTPGRGYGVASGPILGAAGQLLHFMRYVKSTFVPRYERYKRACETTEVTDAIAADPYIRGLFETTADKLIERERFPKAAEALVSQFVHACTGASVHTLNALDYLVCAQGIFDGATRFTFDAEAIEARLAEGSGEVVTGSVAAVERVEGTEGGREDGWRVTTEDGRSFLAPCLVMATPANVTRELIAPIVGDYEIREASKLYAYLVRGPVRDAYAHHDLHLFDESIPLIEIGAREDGTHEIFTCTKDLDLGVFFEPGYEVVHEVDWPHALFTHPSIILKQDLGRGLYRCGDHNALGLEPAAISGVYVANRISGVA